MRDGQNIDFDQLLEDIKVVVRDGQELLRAGTARFKERARRGAETTGRYVQEKPYPTMGMAFGLGLLAGLLAAGMLHSRRHEEEEEVREALRR